MTTKACKKSGRKHTPIVSKKQFGFFGAEYARKKKGMKGRTDMPLAELRRHIKEAKGKSLPRQSRRRKKR